MAEATQTVAIIQEKEGFWLKRLVADGKNKDGDKGKSNTKTLDKIDFFMEKQETDGEITDFSQKDKDNGGNDKRFFGEGRNKKETTGSVKNEGQEKK